MQELSVVHHLPGRIRLQVPGLKGNNSLAKKINQQLFKVPGILMVKANPLTGRVLTKFYQKKINTNLIVQSIKNIINSGKPSNQLPQPKHAEVAVAFENADSGKSDSTCFNWHSLPGKQVLRILNTHLENGLDVQEVQNRSRLHGVNKLATVKPKKFLVRVLDQLKDFLVKALIGSSAVCALLGQFIDALAITVILILNAILGAMQEQKADGALEELSKMTAPTAKVRRSGKVANIAAEELVPGDIVLLEQGDCIPADLRILEAHNLEVEESSLNGEPYPVPKNADTISDCTPLLDCNNLLFMGTNVTSGRSVAVVTAIGMHTEIGKIAGMLNQKEQEPTPLQNKMTSIGNSILKYCLAVSIIIMVAGLLRGGSLFQMILTAVSLAVAAIPEGLPAVVTIAMASGVSRMAQENAVVRRLPAVETLGSATLICTDKTGTITQNRQQVQSVYTAGIQWQSDISNGQLFSNGSTRINEDLTALLTASALCNNADIYWSTNEHKKKNKPRWKVDGDPTEGALLISALNNDLSYRKLREKYCRVKEIPFDSKRLQMSVICTDPKYISTAYIKGAPEVILNRCTQIQKNGKILSFNTEQQDVILNINKQMASKGMRVLAVAYKEVHDIEAANTEKELILLGLVGMVDPPRPEVYNAITTCHKAGIKLAMITGDHPDTALAIAKEVGITDNNKVLTGQQIENLNDNELLKAVKGIQVFARVLPAHKLRLIKTYKHKGEVLAMVGDGINDAPAVKEGNIGVAMGESGTSVTIQASDIVLTDDNFATLVSAVEQGRGIYSNIRRSVRYLLSTNVGLIALMFLTVLLGLPMPLIPIQLLFLNILGDGLPALALGVEKPSSKLMDQPPKPVKESFFADGLNTKILSKGISIGMLGLAAYYWALKHGSLIQARTIAMTTFLTSKMIAAVECSDRKSSHGNYYLIGSIVLSTILLIGAIYLPVGNHIFKTSPLNITNIGTIFIFSVLTSTFDKPLQHILHPNKRLPMSCR